MTLHRHIHLESVYVNGSHDDFTAAVGEKLEEVFGGYPKAKTYQVADVSHSLAFSPDGTMHWSAFLRIEVERETEESDG